MMLLENDVALQEKKTADSCSRLEATIQRYLLIKDEGLIKVILACAISTLLPADPVWLLIVAGSGGAKTELLRGLYELAFAYPVNDITPQTFLSGEKNNPNGSLLHRLPNPTLLIMKDFTTVLEMPAEKRSTILAQLREIYDGDYRKEFGTGESKSWQGKIGFVAGVTQVIDKHQTIFQMLGERFIKYYPTQAEPIELATRALSNSGGEGVMRVEIQQAFKECVEGLTIPDKLEDIPENFKVAIIHLAAFCAQARSGVVRDGYSRDILYTPEPEHPTRIVKQLTNLFQSLAIISDGFSNDDYGLIYKVGMDSLPTVRRLIIECLYSTDTPLTLPDISTAINYPQGTVRRQMEELVCLNVVHITSGGYGLSPTVLNLLNRAFMLPAEDFPEKSQGVRL